MKIELRILAKLPSTSLHFCSFLLHNIINQDQTAHTQDISNTLRVHQTYQTKRTNRKTKAQDTIETTQLTK